MLAPEPPPTEAAGDGRYSVDMDPVEQEHAVAFNEALEPLDDWVHLQPSLDEEKRGRIYLPANVDGARLMRCLVLRAGDQVTDLHPGDVVLVLSAKVIELRDGTNLARREFVIARMQ